MCASPATAAPPRPTAAHRRRRWPMALGVVLLLSGLLAWFAPALAARTSLVNSVLNAIFAGIDGRLAAERASLGWLSPVVLHEVRLYEPDGTAAAVIAEVRSDRSLWQLLTDQQQVGTWWVHRPVLHLRHDTDKTNLERILQPWLDQPASDRPLAVIVQVREATVELAAPTSAGQGKLEQVAVTFQLKKDTGLAWQADVQGQVADADQPGNIQLQAQAAPPSAEAPARMQLHLEAHQVPMEPFQPILQRWLPDTRFGGRLFAAVQLSWNFDGHGSTDLHLDVDTRNLTLTAPQLAGETLTLDQAHVLTRLQQVAGGLDIQQLVVHTDVGRVELAGKLPADASLAHVLTQTAYQLRGDVDLARLSRKLPRTLRLREQVEIEAGRVQFHLTSAEDDRGGRQWRGQLQTSDLVANHAGQHIAWEQPIAVQLAARQEDGNFLLEDFTAESSFLHVQGTGTATAFELSAQADLRQLRDELSRFLDLGDYRLAGTGEATFGWQQTDENTVQVTAQAQMQNFQLGTLDAAMHEPLLVVQFAGQGPVGGWALQSLDSARLVVQAGQDQLRGELVRPLHNFAPPWPVQLDLHGDLARWRRRLEPWLPALRTQEISGQGQVSLLAEVSRDAVHIPRLTARAQPLRIWNAWVTIDEPTCDLQTAADFRPAAGQLELAALHLQSPTLSVDSPATTLDWSAAEPRIEAQLNYRGDLARMSAWWRPHPSLAVWQLAGTLHGQARLAGTSAELDFNLDATADQFVAAHVQGQPIRGPRVELAAAGSYSGTGFPLKLEQLRLSIPGAQLQGAGTFRDEAGRTWFDWNGQLAYDLQVLEPLITPWLGPQVRLAGRGTSPLVLRVPTTANGSAALDPLREAQGETRLAWSSADIYGLRAGPGQVQLTLRDGWLRSSPLDVEINQGRLHLQPHVRLTPPREVVLAGGRAIDKLQITPAMCAAGLKYAAPALADAAEISGRFSLDLADSRILLDDPQRSQLAGKLTFHDIQIGVGTAPVVQALAVLFGYRKPARLREQSEVEFLTRDGRVYHRQMELKFDDVLIRTSGSVGFDESLSMVVTMPMPPRLIEGIRDPTARAALAGRTVQLPFTGRLSAPQVDRRALDQMIAQFVRDAVLDGARQRLDEEAGRLLDAIFGPPREGRTPPPEQPPRK